MQRASGWDHHVIRKQYLDWRDHTAQKRRTQRGGETMDATDAAESATSESDKVSDHVVEIEALTTRLYGPYRAMQKALDGETNAGDGPVELPNTGIRGAILRITDNLRELLQCYDGMAQTM